jgi:hypothetical protein
MGWIIWQPEKSHPIAKFDGLGKPRLTVKPNIAPSLGVRLRGMPQA